MSEYRDALATANERVARLEALAKERGLPQVSKRGRNMAAGAVFVAIASVLTYIGVREVRKLALVEEHVTIVDKKRTPTAPAPPRDLEWFEPYDSWNPSRGPQVAWSQGKQLVVGLLWHRGERTNGLYLGAFDYESLKLVWKVGPFDSEWTGEDDERFRVGVSGSNVILADSAGLLRVFSTDTGVLVGKRDMPRGTAGLCRTVRGGPSKWMVGFGAYNEANTASALFPWELDRIKPYWFDPERLSLVPAPNTPPEGTWCGSADYCDKSRKDGCHDHDGNWHYGDHEVRVKHDAGIVEMTGSTGPDRRAVWKHIAPADDAGDAARAISDKYFFYGYLEGGKRHIVALGLEDGAPREMAELGKSAGARLRLLKWVAPDRLFALYDDEMHVFRTSGEHVGKLSATP